jgi:Fic family protein
MVPRLMARYVQFINERDWPASLPPSIHALLAHFFIATIHSFEDGNGRVARLVSAGILFQRGYQGTNTIPVFTLVLRKTKSNTTGSFSRIHNTHAPSSQKFLFSA